MYRNISLLKNELNHNMTMAVLPVTVFIGVEAFVGMFGNILILLIYYKRYKQSNFRSIVLSLAIVDLTSCCTTLPGEIFSHLNWYDYEYGWICKVKSYFNIFTAWSSASVLLILAFDRYRKICRPLAWQIHSTLAWQMCGFSFILSAFVSIPVTILWGKQTYTYKIDEYNLTVSVCETSDQYAHGIYPLVYIGSVYMLPVSLMIFVAGSLNFITARELFGHSSSFEVRSRRLSISATTLTSLSFATDSANLVGNTTKQNDSNSNEQPNDVLASKLSATSRKSIIASDSYTNICLTSVTSADKYTVFNKHASFSGLHPYVTFSDAVIGTTACENTNATTGNTIVSSDTKSCKVNCDTINSNSCSLTVNDKVIVSGGNNKDGANKESDKVDNRSCDKSQCISSDISNGSDEGQHLRLAEKHSRTKNLKSAFHHRQKTVIMLVLTTVFVLTMTTYVILTSFVAKPDGILKELSNSQKVVFFFFWRLYFVNSVVNPILYGFMDPRFRSGLVSFIPGCKSKKLKVSRAATSMIK